MKFASFFFATVYALQRVWDLAVGIFFVNLLVRKRISPKFRLQIDVIKEMCWHFCQGSLSWAVRLVLPMIAVILVTSSYQRSCDCEREFQALRRFAFAQHKWRTDHHYYAIRYFPHMFPCLWVCFMFIAWLLVHEMSEISTAEMKSPPSNTKFMIRLSGVGGTIVQVDSSGSDPRSRKWRFLLYFRCISRENDTSWKELPAERPHAAMPRGRQDTEM